MNIEKSNILPATITALIATGLSGYGLFTGQPWNSGMMVLGVVCTTLGLLNPFISTGACIWAFLLAIVEVVLIWLFDAIPVKWLIWSVSALGIGSFVWGLIASGYPTRQSLGKLAIWIVAVGIVTYVLWLWVGWIPLVFSVAIWSIGYYAMTRPAELQLTIGVT